MLLNNKLRHREKKSSIDWLERKLKDVLMRHTLRILEMIFKLKRWKRDIDRVRKMLKKRRPDKDKSFKLPRTIN